MKFFSLMFRYLKQLNNNSLASSILFYNNQYQIYFILRLKERWIVQRGEISLSLYFLCIKCRLFQKKCQEKKVFSFNKVLCLGLLGKLQANQWCPLLDLGIEGVWRICVGWAPTYLDWKPLGISLSGYPKQSGLVFRCHRIVSKPSFYFLITIA